MTRARFKAITKRLDSIEAHVDEMIAAGPRSVRKDLADMKAELAAIRREVELDLEHEQ